MTKKKRQRKEQHHQRGNPPPPTPLHANRDGAIGLPDDLWIADEAELDQIDADLMNGVDPLGLGDSGLPYDMRAMERSIAQMERYIAEQGVDLFDDQAMAEMQGVIASGSFDPKMAPKPSTPLERAQDLVYEAFGSSDHAERVRLAKKARGISRDCADAWVLLAEETATTAEEATRLYEEGVHAGERAIGEEAFAELTGEFWLALDTRPYMRARLGLATALWGMERHDEAIGHYQGLLELNPNDNQGIRYTLALALLQEGRDDDLAALLAAYPDEWTANWAYIRALLAYRREGPSAGATKLLREAIKTNPHVPPYLIGREWLGNQALPEFVGVGDESEAYNFVMESISDWLATPGAIDWVREHAGGRPSRLLLPGHRH
jgi:tetratricopeptide (TPR) repeat protein